eukprot:gene25532-33328_t
MKVYANGNVNYDKISNDLEKSHITSWRVDGNHSIGWNNLSWEVKIPTNPLNPFSKKTSRKILDDVKGEVKSSQMLAIMGPSGCGKTSLLDILGNRSGSGKRFGSILIDGAPRARSYYPAYVAQEDTLLGTFTAKETLMYTAALTLDFKLGAAGRLEKVNGIMTDLGLTSCANTIVGDLLFKGLSGGQKRRLSLGLALMNQPFILLLDEPTSGLDAASAYEIMQLLSNLCTSKGLCIVTTIHQPSSAIWLLFDKLMLLSSGKQIYFGQANEACHYFSSIGYTCPKFSNPADYFLTLTNTDFPNHVDINKLNELFKEKISNKIEITLHENKESVAKSFYNPNPSAWHLFVLCHRFFINTIRNPGIIGVRLAMYSMISIAIGGMFLVNGHHTTDKDIQGRMSILEFIFAFYIFQSVAVVPFYMWDSATYNRERLNGDYGPFPFVLANFISTAPGLFLIAFFSLLVAEGFICFLSAIVPHFIIGIALAAGAYGFFMLCNGFFQLKPDIPGWFIWVYYMGFHTYVYRASIVNEFGSRGVLKDAQTPEWKTGHDVLVYMGMNNVSKGDDCWTLSGKR